MGLNFSLKLSLLLAAGFIEIAILGFWLILFRCEPFSMAHKWANTINECNEPPANRSSRHCYLCWLFIKSIDRTGGSRVRVRRKQCKCILRIELSMEWRNWLEVNESKEESLAWFVEIDSKANRKWEYLRSE